MRLNDSLLLIRRSIASSLMRSGLTALGIAIGVLAVALLTSIGEGMREYVLANFSQFGTRIVAVNPGKTLTGGMGGILQTDRPLTLADAAALARLPQVTHMVPIVQGTGMIKAAERSRRTEIIGVNHDVHEAWKFPLALGRALPIEELGRSRQFAVLGAKLKEELFPSGQALGEFIRVGGMRFRVIGVLAEKGQMLGFDLDDLVFIPVDKALTLFNREGLMEINLVFDESVTPVQFSAAVKKRLIERHGSEDFTLTTQDQMLASLDKILSVLTAAVAALGAISLLVGAVGILTIMTTSVRERTSEIGLLAALGAPRQQILWLFLGEATALALLGGLVGLFCAVIVILLVNLALPAFPLTLSPFYLILSLLLSLAIGLLAGLGPARIAARMHPIDALRAE